MSPIYVCIYLFYGNSEERTILGKHCEKPTVWKNEKFSLAEKIFREIDSLVTSLVKPLLSRNFCQKSVRENFYNIL